MRTAKISISMLVAVVGTFITVTGASWAFAVTAANHVLSPHLSRAAERVKIMCLLARNQNEAVDAICKATGAVCPEKLDPGIISASCEE